MRLTSTGDKEIEASAVRAARNANSMALRCPRRSIVVFAGDRTASDETARAVERSLLELGVQARYAGRNHDAGGIATLVASEGADAVELCLSPGARGVLLLRELLRELIAIGLRDVSIVVHRPRD